MFFFAFHWSQSISMSPVSIVNTGWERIVHMLSKEDNQDRRTAPGVCGNGSVLLSHSRNVVTRIGIHTRGQS